MKALSTVILLLLSVSVNAEMCLSWEAPTTRVNGEPLKPGDIKGYTIQHKAGSTGYKNLIWQEFGVTEYVHDVAPGEHCYRMTVTDINKLVSDYSNEVCGLDTAIKCGDRRPGAPVLRFK